MATAHASQWNAPRRGVIEVEGISIAYTDSGGQGPALICLHAIGHSAKDFADLTRRFSSDYRVIAFDFPSHGDSGTDSQPACGLRYTQILSQAIAKLDDRAITFLGNSIGGAVAIRYASLLPDRVKALVLCNPGGLRFPSWLERLFIPTFVLFFAAGRRGAFWFPWAFAQYYRRVLRQEAAREIRQGIIRSAYRIAPILEQAWRSFAKPEENLSSLLPGIRCPVLLAWAKDDFVIPLRASTKAFSRFPNHRLEIFEGGHSAFLEDPEQFEPVLRRFLKQVYPEKKNAV